MSDHVLSSLAEAQAIYRRHCREQEREGQRTEPDAWLSVDENTLVVIVYGFRGTNGSCGPVSIPYEYPIDFCCSSIHEITKSPQNGAGTRKKKELFSRPEPLKAPQRQLHMFKAG